MPSISSRLLYWNNLPYTNEHADVGIQFFDTILHCEARYLEPPQLQMNTEYDFSIFFEPWWHNPWFGVQKTTKANQFVYSQEQEVYNICGQITSVNQHEQEMYVKCIHDCIFTMEYLSSYQEGDRIEAVGSFVLYL